MHDLPQWLRKHLTIIYQPSYEFFLSLHVLSNPEHHTSRLGWAQETLAALPRPLFRDLPYFAELSNSFLDIMDILSPWEESYQHSVEAGLELISGLSAEEFAEIMLGRVYHRRQVQEWIAGRADEAFELVKPVHRQMLRHPLATKRRFLEFCYAYLPIFQAEQRRIEPWLVRAVMEAEEQAATDPVTFLSQVHPRLHVHEDSLLFHKAKTYTFAYSDLSHVYLCVTTFVSPHLLLGIYPEHITVGLSVDVPGTAAKATIPADFIAKMKVFGDPTRAAILKSLLGHPYCTQQLAELHGITEPAVTKHLKLLTDAGFVWSERRGRYVFYRGLQVQLEQLSVDLHEFIDMPAPGLSIHPPHKERRK
ncbi:metalloregulator ArsR/SmtB family transcription factor [Brevibacillus choshinensis]|uniref:ArsR/SmtB family transcription factor n=1 Tax=Brevibacillus choshinensis TaxID=54911 RepID=UPI002E1CA85D|nr:metalloregulator ArsR/SmtB family transcription factor [Brevibacillus choshinensis]